MPSQRSARAVLRPVAPKGRANSERLLGAAATLFVDRGYSATTMRELARSVDMQAGSLYYHFSSKQELLEAMLQRTVGELFEAVARVLREPDRALGYRAAFRRAVNTHLTITHDRSTFFHAISRLFSEASEEVRERHLSQRRRLAGLWERFFAEAAAAGEIRGDIDLPIAVRFVTGGLDSTHQWYEDAEVDVERMTDMFTRMVFDGMAEPKALPGPPPPS